MNIKKIISLQRSLARKAIASIRLQPLTAKGITDVSNERAFLKADFNGVKTLEDVMAIVHKIRHKGLNKAGKYTRCKLCKAIMNETREQISDVLPKFGNLIAVLEQEAANEKAHIGSKRVPTQNDLTRWALKDAVLVYYKGLSIRPDMPVVESRYDDRLVDALAPDFDVIAKIWLQKLDELKRRNDAYTLNIDEVDRAEADLFDGMQGSAFEKFLDRYRIEWMSKLPR